MEEIKQDMMSKLEDTQKGKFLTFFLDGQTYGIEIRFVDEIIGMQSITTVPELPDYINGIINLRGKIIPVMDIRVRFGKEKMQYNERTSIIVVDYEEYSIGLIVDMVAEVLNIAEENISNPPKIGSNALANEYVKGIGKVNRAVKLILDIEVLLSDAKFDDIVPPKHSPTEDRRS